MGNFVKFRIYIVARATGAVQVARLIFGVGVSTLDHETGDDAVETSSGIEPIFGELLETCGVLGSVVGEEFYDNSTVVGVDNDDFIAFGGSGCSGRGGVAEFTHGCFLVCEGPLCDGDLGNFDSVFGGD